MSDEGRFGGRQPQAIRSALKVLGIVARGGPGTTVRQVCEQSGLPPATAYRIVGLLVAEEYLVRLSDLHGLALGARMAELLPPTGSPDPPGRASPPDLRPDLHVISRPDPVLHPHPRSTP